MSEIEKKNENVAQEKGVLEKTFSEIEEIITNLESQDMDLDESFALYEAGMKKLKICNEEIDKVEKKMLVLNEQGELEEF